MPASVRCTRGAGPATVRRGSALLITALLMATPGSAGCSGLDEIRRPPPQPSAQPAPAPPPGPSGPASWLVQSAPGMVEVRAPALPVGAGFGQQVVEFADASNGVAMFVRCAPAGEGSAVPDGCTAVLLASTDGGRSWRQRPHPRLRAAHHQLYLGRDGILLLLAEPHGWYVSRDLGATFRPVPPGTGLPAEYHQLAGRYQLCCDGDEVPRVVRWTDGRSRPVPTQPGLPGRLASVAYRDGGGLWVASLSAGRGYAAVSRDEGRSWQQTALPGPPPAVLGDVSLHLSADGADVWMIGGAQHRRVAFWRFDNGAWRRLPATATATAAPVAGAAVPGLPEVSSAAPAGAGLLVVTGPRGSGLIGERYTPADWPLSGWVEVLADGSLFARSGRAGVVWLAPGQGAVRRWIRLELLPK